jgi:2-amino-4-hydroxy-6-hydroxymethyldihydropteridine diphosphokinase
LTPIGHYVYIQAEREGVFGIMNTAYLGLGSNLGNRLAFIRGGRDILANGPDIELAQASGVYETEAVGGPPDNPLFLNTVLKIQTSLEPGQLLEVCLAAEDEFGRSRQVRWAPRTLDVDILFYADQVLCEENLTIPHPRLHERAFVLAPLMEIAPDLKHPLLDQTITEIAAGSTGVAELAPLRTTW